jgi:capsular polysaccharide biosynthesis protein
MGSFGVIFLVEMLDQSIRGSRELAGVVDSHLVVAIPYILTTGEILQKKRKIILLWAILAVVLLAGLAVALYIGIQIDFSWFDRPWLDSLTRLTK